MSETQQTHIIETDCRLRRRKGISWQELDSESVVLNPFSRTVHEFNPTATWLWSRLDGEASMEALCSGLCEEFDIDMDTALADALEFGREALRSGLVEVR